MHRICKKKNFKSCFAKPEINTINKNLDHIKLNIFIHFIKGCKSNKMLIIKIIRKK